jgi:peptidyl-prolyl cis-trans isomerase SurA
LRPDRNESGARRRGVVLRVLCLLLLVSGPACGADKGKKPPEPQPPAGASVTPQTTPLPPGRTAEDVAAVVGTTPILRSEVEDQVKAAADQLQADLSDTSISNRLHREILGRLVDEQVLLLEAATENIKVGEDEIKQAVDDEIENNIRSSGGRDAFLAELKKEGMTETDLRQRYHDEARKQMLNSRLIQKVIRPKVEVPDSIAVRKFYDENRSDLPKKPRQFRVQDLFIATKPDSLIERRARENALDVRKKILAGMSFEEAARTYSDDPRGKEGGSLGRASRGQLADRELENAAFDLKVGEVSQPVRSRFGYHLVEVTARDSAGAWVDVSHILFNIPSSKADEVATKERADRVYQEVASGKIDFSEAIHRYSDDAEARGRDGDMGWIPFDNIYGEMKQAVDTLRVGRLSRPVAGDGGYHIFKVLGEQAEGNYAFEEIQDQLKQLAAQQAMEKELRSWLQELRKKYFVEVRAHW